MRILLFFVFASIAVSLGYWIARRVVRSLARWWFDGNVSFRARHFRKYGYAYGFAFFEGESSVIGWRTCILTIIYYAIGLPIILFLLIKVMPLLFSLVQP